MSKTFRSTVPADEILPRLIPLSPEGGYPWIGFAIRGDFRNLFHSRMTKSDHGWQ